MDEDEQKDWSKRAGRAEYLGSKRFGLDIGTTTTALHVCTLRGMKKTEEGALVKEYMNPTQEELVPVQSVVIKVALEDPRFIERKAPPVSESYPIGSNVYFFGTVYYGTLATVVGHNQNNINIQMVVPVDQKHSQEPSFGAEALEKQNKACQYISSFVLADRLNINAFALSKITSSLQIMNATGQRVNVGLNLKFEAKQQKVIGYTRKNGTGHWEYSEKAVELIGSYVNAFPQFMKLVQNSKGVGKYYIYIYI